MVSHRPAPLLAALALGAFAVGCTEFAAVALLPQVATDLGVSEGLAGQLVTLNAVAVVVGAPVLGALFARRSGSAVAASALVAFALAHGAAAVAGSFWLVALTRVVSGAAFGLFQAAAFGLAPRAVGPERPAPAMAAVQSGITASTALGIPAGLTLGRLGGGTGGWRLPFGVIGALALVAAVAVASTGRGADRDADRDEPARPLERLAVVRRGPVALGLLTTAVFWGGSFGGLTYLVPYLEREVGLGVGTVIVVLVVAGALSVAGTWLGGIAADARPAVALLTSAVVAAMGLVLLYGLPHLTVVALVGLAVWQLGTWSFVPVVQARLHELGGDQGEAAVSYAVAAFNVGIVAGAAVGGLLLDRSGFEAVGTMSVLLAVVAVLLSVAVNRRLRQPSSMIEA